MSIVASTCKQRTNIFLQAGFLEQQGVAWLGTHLRIDKIRLLFNALAFNLCSDSHSGLFAISGTRDLVGALPTSKIFGTHTVYGQHLSHCRYHLNRNNQ